MPLQFLSSSILRHIGSLHRAGRLQFGRIALNLSIFIPRLRLRKRPLKILVDSTILAHGITHETAWISTGTTTWGQQDIATGYAARISVHAPTDQSRVYAQARYLPGIAALAKLGRIELYTSAELRAEVLRQPIGRFQGYGYFDHNLFADVKIKSVDGFHLDIDNAKERQLARVNSRRDEPFLSILQLLGQKNSLDAWHIHTSERHQMFCFLYIDFPLRESLSRKNVASLITSFNTKALMPSELARLIGLFPIHTSLLSYEGASFPVYLNGSWPNQRRNSPSRARPKTPPKSPLI